MANSTVTFRPPFQQTPAGSAAVGPSSHSGAMVAVDHAGHTWKVNSAKSPSRSMGGQRGNARSSSAYLTKAEKQQNFVRSIQKKVGVPESQLLPRIMPQTRIERMPKALTAAVSAMYDWTAQRTSDLAGSASDTISGVLTSAYQGVKSVAVSVDDIFERATSLAAPWEGARAAPTDETQSCPVGTSCEDGASNVARSTVQSFKDHVRKNFSIKESALLNNRQDQSLKGTIVLLGDTNHHNQKIRGDLNNAVTPFFQRRWFFTPGDRILVERFDDESGWMLMATGACGDIPFPILPIGDSGCTGIESREAYIATQEALVKFHTATDVLTRYLLEKAPTKRRPSGSESLSRENTNRIVNELIGMAEQKQIPLTAEERRHYEALLREADTAGQAFAKERDRTMPLRDDHYVAMVEQYFNPETTTYIRLGATHTHNIWSRIAAKYPALYICHKEGASAEC